MLLFLFVVSLLSFSLSLSSSMSDNEVNCNYCSTTIAYSRECTPLMLDLFSTDAIPMKKMSLATTLEELHWKIRSQWLVNQSIRSSSRPTSLIESLATGKDIGAIALRCSIRCRCLDVAASFSPSSFTASDVFYRGISCFIVSRWVNEGSRRISLFFSFSVLRLLQVSWWWFRSLSAALLELLCFGCSARRSGLDGLWPFHRLPVRTIVRRATRRRKRQQSLAYCSSGDTKRRIVPSIVVLITMFILQVLFAVFDARDCKIF